MKATLFSVGVFLFLGAVAAKAEVCGLLEASNASGASVLNIADTHSFAGKQQNYRILNTQDFKFDVGKCICVEGEASLDPLEGYEDLYMQIQVTKINSQGDTGCKKDNGAGV